MNALTVNREDQLVKEGLTILARREKDRQRLIAILKEVSESGTDPKTWAMEKWRISFSQAGKYVAALRAVTTRPERAVTKSIAELAKDASTRKTYEHYVPPPPPPIRETKYDREIKRRSFVRGLYEDVKASISMRLFTETRKEFVEHTLKETQPEIDIYTAIKVFGLVPGVSWEFVELGVRSMIQKAHPDKGGSGAMLDLYVKCSDILKENKEFFRS